MIKLGYLACRDIRVLDRVQALNDQHDDGAAADYALDHGCRAVPTGTNLIVTRFSLEHGAYCLRSRNEGSCSWLPTWSVLGVTP